ncbi:glycosyltransferase [Flavobacterium inviolabile]|uniref:glycosyltransferase n=1 Tax=Flavobacterium inviolabile TaxID=2748320 RepID=UPI0015ABE795|nr:glycosyltransferase [Flavobacterium inviolabile]
MKNKKIIIIASAIFPFQSPRANRATELAKEFGKQGHDVTIYGVLGDYDYSVFEAKNNVKVKNIEKMTFATLNSDNSGKDTFLNKILRRLLGRWLEFPNIEFMFKMTKILKKEKGTDMLISIAYPHPIHWGCALAKARMGIKFPKLWVADCGDPYMGNPIETPVFYFKYIEKWFCRNVDYITIPIEEGRSAYYSDFRDKIKVIPQGFDFDLVRIDSKEPNNEVPTFIYSGVFYQGVRDPRVFLDYLSKVLINFKFIIYTQSKDILEPYKSKLGEKLIIKDYVTREELLVELAKADFLVNFENGNAVQSPSKLIDYALAKRPIMSVSSFAIDEDNIERFLKGDYSGKLEVHNIDQYDIRNVANKFISLSSGDLLK